jgi:hypothetical protein
MPLVLIEYGYTVALQFLQEKKLGLLRYDGTILFAMEATDVHGTRAGRWKWSGSNRRRRRRQQPRLHVLLPIVAAVGSRSPP